MNADYIIRFVAYPEKVFPCDYSKECFAVEKLLAKEIFVKITSELAKKVYATKTCMIPGTSYINVEVLPTVFEKFIITETGSNYEVQTVDVLRLLEYWEALEFPSYIEKSPEYHQIILDRINKIQNDNKSRDASFKA
ncbi:MAG: hypothetical protein GPJ00_05455 [Microcystis aeruginosa W13-18]|nr:hypothetical protein [Microcystis aeruginosa W13-18]NCR35156.1 hypothetical protein [Microcystis aeruginosa S11-05]NCR48672.1 hypothetical protein [Microcystis aeruginosa S11-01]